MPISNDKPIERNRSPGHRCSKIWRTAPTRVHLVSFIPNWMKEKPIPKLKMVVGGDFLATALELARRMEELATLADLYG